MKRTTTTEIIIEQEEVCIYRHVKKSVLVWCESCCAEVEVIAPERAARFTALSVRGIYRLVEANLIHSHETPDGLLYICAPSLAGVHPSLQITELLNPSALNLLEAPKGDTHES